MTVDAATDATAERSRPSLSRGGGLALAAGLAVATTGVFARLQPSTRVTAGAQLVTLVAAGSYVATAVRSGDAGRAVREVAAASVFAGAGLAAAATHPRVLGWVLAAHAGWDLALHRLDPDVQPTGGYGVFCAVYDVLGGVALHALLPEDPPT